MKTTIPIGKIETCNIHPTSKYLIRKDCLLEKEIFSSPSGKAGKHYIEELTRLPNDCINESATKETAFKAAMAKPSILLQKPSKTSKAKDHLSARKKRLKDWFSGDILEPLHEGETIKKN